MIEGPGLILLDGALGTELLRNNVDLAQPLWSAAALERNAPLIRKIHRHYIQAGARIITANTFRTTTYSYEQAGFSARESGLRALAATRTALALAKTAIGDSGALVALSMAPVDDCYTPEAYPGAAVAAETYQVLAETGANAGADLALIETQINLEEALIALDAAGSVGLVALVSFLVDDNMKLWHGDPLHHAVQQVNEYGAVGILVNCVTLPLAGKAAKELAERSPLPWGIYANRGTSQPSAEGIINEYYSNADFAGAAVEWARLGARFIGGCCGTTPDTIAAVHQALESRV